MVRELSCSRYNDKASEKSGAFFGLFVFIKQCLIQIAGAKSGDFY